MMAAFFVGLSLLMLFSSHLVAFRLCGSGELSGRIVATFVVYVAQVVFSLLLMGRVVNSLNPSYLLILNGSISVAVTVYLKSFVKSSTAEACKKIKAFFRFVVCSKDYFLYVMLFLFCLQLVVLLVKIYYLPPSVGDVFAYHLHPVVEWFQQGQILPSIDTPVDRANLNPLGTKYLHLWFVVFLKELTWVELPQFLFGFILVVSSYALMSDMKIGKNQALRYAILIYFVPMVLLQSRTCQDHLIFASCIIVVILYTVKIFFKNEHEYVPLLFLAVGFLLGIKKHSLLVVLVLLAGLLLCKRLTRGRLAAIVKGNPVGIGVGALVMSSYTVHIVVANKSLYTLLANRYSSRIILPALLSLILIVGLYIILKRVLGKFEIRRCIKKRLLIFTLCVCLILGTAVYYLAGQYNWSKYLAWEQNSTAINPANQDFVKELPTFMGNMVRNLLALPYRIKDIGLYTSYTPDLLKKSGWGIQIFVFGLISFLIMIPLCAFKREIRDSVVGFLLFFAVFLLTAYFFIYFSWANYRAFLFFGVIGIFLWAFIQEKLFLRKYYLRYIDVLILSMILFSGFSCLFEGNMSPKQWKTTLTMTNPVDRTSIKFSGLVGKNNKRKSWEFIDNHMQETDNIGYSGGRDAWTLPYFDNRMKRRIYYLNSLPGFRVEEEKVDDETRKVLTFSEDFKISLMLRGIHYIHFSTQGTPKRFKLYIKDGNNDNIYRVTDNLYYFDW